MPLLKKTPALWRAKSAAVRIGLGACRRRREACAEKPRHVAEQGREECEALRAEVRSSFVVHADETGVRQDHERPLRHPGE